MEFNAENFLKILENKQIQEMLGGLLRDSMKEEIQKLSSLLNDRVDSLTNDVETLRKENDFLKDQLEEQRQYSMKEDLIVYDEKLSNSTNIRADFSNFCKEELKVDVNVKDISAAHPLGPVKDKTRPVIVRFVNRAMKTDVYRARLCLKKRPKGAKTFINEHLTKARAQTFKRARQMRAVGEVQDAWTYDCAVCVRDNKGVVHRVACESDLVRIARVTGPTNRLDSDVQRGPKTRIDSDCNLGPLNGSSPAPESRTPPVRAPKPMLKKYETRSSSLSS